MAKNLISDAGDLRKYYTQIPNMIDDLDLSMIAFRLYVHLKRVTGESGVCWQSSGTLAKACGMSTGAVSKAKLELALAGLIVITKKKDHLKAYHEIILVDIWRQNIEKYASLSQGDDSLSRGEILPSLGERLPSPGETKNNPPKDIPLGRTKEEESALDPYDAMQRTIELLTGYPPTQRDIIPTNQMIKDGVIEDDLRAAVAFFASIGKVARGAADLQKSAMVAKGKRTQSAQSLRPKQTYLDADGNPVTI